MYYKITGPDLKSFILKRSKLSHYQPQVDLANKIAIQYKLDEWVYEKNLFVFNDLKRAKTWLGWDLQEYHIYECEVLRPKKPRGIIDWRQLEEILECVKRLKGKKKYTHLLYEPAPEGSMVCSGVKLLERVC